MNSAKAQDIRVKIASKQASATTVAVKALMRLQRRHRSINVRKLSSADKLYGNAGRCEVLHNGSVTEALHRVTGPKQIDSNSLRVEANSHHQKKFRERVSAGPLSLSSFEPILLAGLKMMILWIVHSRSLFLT